MREVLHGIVKSVNEVRKNDGISRRYVEMLVMFLWLVPALAQPFGEGVVEVSRSRFA